MIPPKPSARAVVPMPPITADCVTGGAGPERYSTIQSVVSARKSSVMSSENFRRTTRHRSAASLAVPSVGPSTSRTHSEAQSYWSVCSRRCTACAVATFRIQPDVTPKYRSQPRQATASSSDRYPHPVAVRPSTPVRSSSGSAAPTTTPSAVTARRARAQWRLATRSAR